MASVKRRNFGNIQYINFGQSRFTAQEYTNLDDIICEWSQPFTSASPPPPSYFRQSLGDSRCIFHGNLPLSGWKITLTGVIAAVHASCRWARRRERGCVKRALELPKGSHTMLHSVTALGRHDRAKHSTKSETFRRRGTLLCPKTFCKCQSQSAYEYNRLWQYEKYKCFRDLSF